MPNLAPQMPRRLPSMAWNTGSKSPGELTDDLKHFGGGVCCSSASRKFVEQPRVLDGDDCLSCEFVDKLDLLVGERTNLLAVHEDTCRSFVFLQHWDGEKVRVAAKFNRTDVQSDCFNLELLAAVGDVNYRFRRHHAGRRDVFGQADSG